MVWLRWPPLYLISTYFVNSVQWMVRKLLLGGGQVILSAWPMVDCAVWVSGLGVPIWLEQDRAQSRSLYSGRHPATAGHLHIIQLPSTGLNPRFRHSTVDFTDITNNIYSIHRNANTLISIVGINPLKYSGPISRRIPCRHQRSWSSHAKHQVCIV